MFAHFLGFLVLLGSALLVVLGLGVVVFALARGNLRLAGRAAAITIGFGVLYLVSNSVIAALVPRQVLPVGDELSFCGFDCHLHVSVVGSDMEENRIGVMVRVRSDAKQEAEYPTYLRFRLVGAKGVIVVPDNEARAFRRPLEAGQSYVDSLYFAVPLDQLPYSLRVTYPGPIDALLFGPASSAATGKMTLSLGGSQP
jgi:hypothetical protein